MATLRGHGPIRDRAVDLVERADDHVILVGVRDATVRDGLAAALDERAAAGVDVTVVTDDAALADRLSGVQVVVSEASGDEGYAGSTLLVDDATVLLSVPTDGHEPFDEVAMWTAETRIGHILARFVHAGMESGLDEGALDGR